jgi:hypothetical protein
VLVRLRQEVQEVPRRLGRLGVAALVLGAVLAGSGGQAVSADPTVTISGRAYAFNHMDTYIAGATIRVRELPQLEATTDANGDYSLKVPDDRNVTPYIDPPPGYHQIDLQTFHPRGKPIRNANFQTPADAEYNGLAALLEVPLGPDGRPQQCVIVTTASARNVRGVDYETFHERTPHGVPGATAHAEPALPSPVYFNENVIPDRTQTATSDDGGIIWTEVPAGAYRVITGNVANRFASFLATCEAGRIVNANPPWGAYELGAGEKPLSAGTVAGAVTRVGRGTRAGNRLLILGTRSAEPLRAKLVLEQSGRQVGRTETARFMAGGDKTPFRVDPKAEAGPARLKVTLTDAGGDKVVQNFPVRLPPPLGG